MENKSFQEIYKTLSAIDVNSMADTLKTRDGQELSYVPWATALDAVSKVYDVNFRIVEFDLDGHELAPTEHGMPFQALMTSSSGFQSYEKFSTLYAAWMKNINNMLKAGVSLDSEYFAKTTPQFPEQLKEVTKTVGFFVVTEVTIEGYTKRMWLPVFDQENRSIRNEGYGQDGQLVEPINAMAINKAIMRCLVKNLALFGFGIEVFKRSKEDLPSAEQGRGMVESQEMKVMTLDEAKTHITENQAGRITSLIGKSMYNLLLSAKKGEMTRTKAKNFLLAYSEANTSDGACARALLDIFDEEVPEVGSKKPEEEPKTKPRQAEPPKKK